MMSLGEKSKKGESFIIKLSEEGKNSDISSIFPQNEAYTFLVGAGISMDPPSNVPSARMFVKKLFKYYAPDPEIENLLNLESLRYEFLVENIQSFFDKDLKFLDYLDQVREPNVIHMFLADMIHRYSYVITTNFDYLIEIALMDKLSIYPPFHQNNKKRMSIITKEDYQKKVFMQFPVIKIHGSKRDVFTGRLTTESLITTISALGRGREEGKTFAIEPYKRKLVDEVMFGRNLVVMGYSGSDDFDIGPLLKELRKMKKIIWIDHDQGGITNKEEFYKYKPIQDISLLESEISKLNHMLLEIASSSEFEVYKIKAKTNDFVKQRLAPVFNVKFEECRFDDSKKIQSFDSYMEENHFKVSLSSKYKLAHEIYYNLGDIDSAERTALKGLSLSQDENEKINQMYFMNALGLIQNLKGDYNQALENFQEALILTENLGKKNDKLGVLINIGHVYMNKSDNKSALKYITEALDLTNDDTPALIKFSISNSLGVIYRDNGDMPNAIKSIEDALKISEKTGDLYRKSLCFNNLAEIKLTQGLLQPALNYASEALKIDEQLGNLDNMCNTLNTIGNIFRTAGQYETALNHFEKAFQVAEKIKDVGAKALVLNSIGVIFYQKGEYSVALEKYEEALQMNEEIGNLSGKATGLNNIGMFYRTKGDYNKALDFFNQSIKITEDINENKYLAIRYGNLASIYEATRQFDKAVEVYNKTLSMEKSQGNLEGVAKQLINIGGILGDLGKYQETIKNYEQALNIMENIGNKLGIADSLNNLGVIYYKYLKNHEKSIEYLQQAFDIYSELNIPPQITSTRMNLDVVKKAYEALKSKN